MFTDPDRKSSTLGVTVNPIKIAGLEQFGNVETVRKKLIDTEKQKVGVAVQEFHSLPPAPSVHLHHI